MCTESVNVNRQPTSYFAPLTDLQNLDVASVEAVLVELLDAVQTEQVPVAARQEMHEFYDRFQHWRNHFLHHFAPFVCEADRWFDVTRKQPRLLDLGCGLATPAHLLAMRGATIVGLDNNAGRVAAGRAMREWFASLARPKQLNVTLHAEDAFAWLERQPAGSFDGCFTQFALAYMRPHRRMLELIDRAIRPGGLMMFREFNAGSLYNRIVSRVDWLTSTDYQQVADRLGWTCQSRQFHWLMPRRIINWSPTYDWLRALETRLTNRPRIGPRLAAAMTLVYEKPASHSASSE
jgi:SAM-dependent methyltransferase